MEEGSNDNANISNRHQFPLYRGKHAPSCPTSFHARLDPRGMGIVLHRPRRRYLRGTERDLLFALAISPEFFSSRLHRGKSPPRRSATTGTQQGNAMERSRGGGGKAAASGRRFGLVAINSYLRRTFGSCSRDRRHRRGCRTTMGHLNAAKA